MAEIAVNSRQSNSEANGKRLRRVFAATKWMNNVCKFDCVCVRELRTRQTSHSQRDNSVRSQFKFEKHFSFCLFSVRLWHAARWLVMKAVLMVTRFTLLAHINSPRKKTSKIFKKEDFPHFLIIKWQKLVPSFFAWYISSQ